MKKFITLLMALLLVLSVGLTFVACDSDEDEPAESNGTTAVADESGSADTTGTGNGGSGNGGSGNGGSGNGGSGNGGSGNGGSGNGGSGNGGAGNSDGLSVGQDNENYNKFIPLT